jgi:ubiquinol-cytochrome c reductase cytochrome b/c1 subunit
MGVIALFGSIAILALLPWLDTSSVKSARYRPLYRQFFWFFVATCVLLGWLGSKPAEGWYVYASRVLTAWYFIYLLIVLPLLGIFETPKQEPKSITDALKAAGKAVGVVLLAMGIGGAVLAGASQPAAAADEKAKQEKATNHETPPPPRNKWSFAGLFGKFDQAQLQRGFKVYRDVCQTCHSLNLVAFRTLGEEGGPHFSEAQVAAIASDYQIAEINEAGETVKRPARPADYFTGPYDNEQQARSANSKLLPPDLSVMAKARQYERGFPAFVFDVFAPYQELGVDYIVALLTGYDKAPPDVDVPSGLYYNTYFPGHSIGMSQQLTDGSVDYTDGTKQTAENYAKDVAAFLMWTAEPTLEQRKRIGFVTLIFVLGLTILLFLSKKKVWHDVDHPHETKTSA